MLYIISLLIYYLKYFLFLYQIWYSYFLFITFFLFWVACYMLLRLWLVQTEKSVYCFFISHKSQFSPLFFEKKQEKDKKKLVKLLSEKKLIFKNFIYFSITYTLVLLLKTMATNHSLSVSHNVSHIEKTFIDKLCI